MSDRAFTGRDVPEALAEASRTLGVPVERLRYVVLEAGSPGARGMAGTPARIAVLVDTGGAGAPPTPRAPAAPPPPLGPLLRGLVRALAEAAGVDLGAEVEESEGTVTVRVEGPGCSLLLEEDGEVLRALEHLLQRAASRPGARQRVVVSCPGYREKRDDDLRAEAKALAQAVRHDGQPRETRPLNAYERRIVHIAVSEEPGLRTFSVGEGADRRVTVARAEPEAAG
jgi:spoIIIJ-associated protein